VLSLKAGGTGLNLTAATHVVHYDRWWNPAVEDQATDRAYRIGQTKAVTVHRIITEGTVEDRVADRGTGAVASPTVLRDRQPVSFTTPAPVRAATRVGRELRVIAATSSGI
jgi:hypothetical protein